MKPLAKPAIKAVEEGRIRFVPERFRKVYLNWMENVHDWCISRQLWWGHRIPVWYCDECKEAIAAVDTPSKCPKCGSGTLTQDPDVLDTWFSSALWPFSTMGWPDETPELRHFYPTSVLVTAYDIIFFWVARMIVMGLEFMEDVPFHDVLIHGLVRASSGKKMSKSLGTGVDPLEIVDKYGADVLRFTLVMGNTPGNDMRFREERLEASRNFGNKLWNASRFAIMNLDDFSLDSPGDDSLSASDIGSNLTLADRWIRSRANKIAGEVSGYLNEYEIGEAARALYNFTWDEFCDWYIEIAKSRLYSSDAKARKCAQYVLWETLKKTLALLHPFIPFITEAIWGLLPETEGSVMISEWPMPDNSLDDPEAEEAMGVLMDTVRAIRNIRSEMNIPPHKKIEAVIVADSFTGRILRDNSQLVTALSGLSGMMIKERLDMRPEKAASQIISGAEIYVPLVGIIDIDVEIQKLEKDLDATRAAAARSQKKLSNKGFLEKAQEEIVEKEREKLAEFLGKEERLRKRLNELKE
jgi:valyl-tRNA synthetase